MPVQWAQKVGRQLPALPNRLHRQCWKFTLQIINLTHPLQLYITLSDVCYLHQGVYVIVVVCLSVGLSVSNFAQKLLNGFA